MPLGHMWQIITVDVRVGSEVVINYRTWRRVHVHGISLCCANGLLMRLAFDRR